MKLVILFEIDEGTDDIELEKEVNAFVVMSERPHIKPLRFRIMKDNVEVIEVLPHYYNQTGWRKMK